LFLLLLPARNAGAFPLPLPLGPRLDSKVVSLKEGRTVGLVVQRRDYSCGAAALATLLTYHFGRPTSEEEILRLMEQVGNEEIIKEKGFSLLDMKRSLEKLNYQSAGFKLDVAQLAKVKIPGVILIDTMSYKHFVVFKGLREGLAFLADPALGNRAISLEELEKAWNGVFLAAVGSQSEDSPGFKFWKPEVRGLSRALRARDRAEQLICLDPTVKLWDITPRVRNSPWRD
jgi:hypothetical protein